MLTATTFTCPRFRLQATTPTGSQTTRTARRRTPTTTHNALRRPRRTPTTNFPNTDDVLTTQRKIRTTRNTHLRFLTQSQQIHQVPFPPALQTASNDNARALYCPRNPTHYCNHNKFHEQTPHSREWSLGDTHSCGESWHLRCFTTRWPNITVQTEPHAPDTIQQLLQQNTTTTTATTAPRQHAGNDIQHNFLPTMLSHTQLPPLTLFNTISWENILTYH